jgi:hypothetical protein
MLNLWKIAAAILLSFALMGSASAQVVALGASNTQGHGVGASESYPAQLQAMLRAGGPACVLRMQAFPEIRRRACWLDCRAPFLMVPKSSSCNLEATIAAKFLSPCARRTSPIFSSNFANVASGSSRLMDWYNPLGRLAWFNRIKFI